MSEYTDVKQVIKNLRKHEWNDDIADLIERLARENEYGIRHNEKLERRIEELEINMRGLASQYTAKIEHSEAEIKRLDAALAEIEQIDSNLPNGGGPAIQLARKIARKARAEE